MSMLSLCDTRFGCVFLITTLVLVLFVFVDRVDYVDKNKIITITNFILVYFVLLEHAKLQFSLAQLIIIEWAQRKNNNVFRSFFFW